MHSGQLVQMHYRAGASFHCCPTSRRLGRTCCNWYVLASRYSRQPMRDQLHGGCTAALTFLPAFPWLPSSCRPTGDSKLGWAAVLLGPTVASTCRACAGSAAAGQGVQPDCHKQPHHCWHVQPAHSHLQHQPVSRALTCGASRWRPAASCCRSMIVVV